MLHLHLRLCKKNPGVQPRGFRLALVFLALTFLTSPAGSVHAKKQKLPPKPNKWVVTISDDPDPVPSKGDLTYKVAAKNDGKVKSTDVKITIDLPPEVQFVSCKTSADTKIKKYCLGLIGGQVIAALPVIKAHRTVTVTVVTSTPTVSASTDIFLAAKAEGESTFKGDATERTTILTPDVTATLLPSGRIVAISCGAIFDAAFFQSDNIVQLNNSLGCTTSELFGLKIAQSGVTLNLQGKKIFMSGQKLGNAGIVIENATDVTIDGGGTNGTNGIETFDWCVKDGGGNAGLMVKNLRCYKARSAAIDLVSDNVTVEKVKIDSTTPTSTTTQELPGGVGIHASGDNIHIKDTIVRRSKLIGILADGVDTDLSDYVTTIDGNLSNSRVENSFGIGVVFRNGPHLLKDTAVYGDGPGSGTSTDGVVVDTGTANELESVVVKKFNNNGVVINASGTIVDSSGVEEISQNGFVISALANNVILNGNSSQKLDGHGFVVEGDNNHLITNDAERNVGDGFQVSGNGNVVENSSAQENDGHGFVVEGDNNHLITNDTEKNAGDGFQVSGNGNVVRNGSAKANSGVGFVIAGGGNICGTNSAENNSGLEWSIGVNNLDDGSNSANGRRFSFTAAGGVFE